MQVQLKRVGENHVLFTLHLKVLLHVLTDYLDFAFRSLAKLLNYQIRIVITKLEKKIEIRKLTGRCSLH